jgi:hypothetical protein
VPAMGARWDEVHSPTFELASVSEFKVVDLPLEGFPTRPISGSRGIIEFNGGSSDCDWYARLPI